MTNAIAKYETGALEQAAIVGDLSKLTAEQRLAYYQSVCQSTGLNPLTKPFDYIMLNGKLTLYCRKDATDQLRKIHNVSVQVVGRETIEGVHVVTAQAHTPDGRTDEEIGAVTIANLKGDALANALMKAVTKAKRRVTLSICGLGWMDETETETVPNARAVYVDPDSGVIDEKPRHTNGTTPAMFVHEPPQEAIVREPVAEPEPAYPDNEPTDDLPESVDILRRLIHSMSKPTYHSNSIPLIQSDEVLQDAIRQIQTYAGSALKALAVASIIVQRQLKNFGQLSYAEASALVYWSRPANSVKAKADIDAILAAKWEGD